MFTQQHKIGQVPTAVQTKCENKSAKFKET